MIVLTVLSYAIAVDCSKHNGINWDGILSCEFLGAYKGPPNAYNTAIQTAPYQTLRSNDGRRSHARPPKRQHPPKCPPPTSSATANPTSPTDYSDVATATARPENRHRRLRLPRPSQQTPRLNRPFREAKGTRSEELTQGDARIPSPANGVTGFRVQGTIH